MKLFECEEYEACCHSENGEHDYRCRKGSPVCPTCDGMGYWDCPDCQGSGIWRTRQEVVNEREDNPSLPQSETPIFSVWGRENPNEQWLSVRCYLLQTDAQDYFIGFWKRAWPNHFFIEWY